MRFLRRNAPDVPLEKVADVLVEEYGVEGDLTTFESERDQNVRVDTVERSYLFKVCNSDEDEAVIDLQIQALRHIERVDSTVPVPRALSTLTGAATGSVLSPDGTSHTVRLMSFVDGVVAGSRPEFDTPTFRRNTGATLAHLDRALRGFFHPAAHQDHPWDVSRAPRLLETPDTSRTSRPAATWFRYWSGFVITRFRPVPRYATKSSIRTQTHGT